MSDIQEQDIEISVDHNKYIVQKRVFRMIHSNMTKKDILRVRKIIKDSTEFNDLEASSGSIDWNVPCNETGWTCLHKAVYEGIKSIVTCFLKRVDELDLIVDVKDKNSTTPLHIAAEVGNSLFCSYLICKEADCSEQREDGKTPLHLAIINGQIEATELLLNKGSPTNIEDNIGLTGFELLVKTLPDLAQVCMDNKRKQICRLRGSIGSITRTKPVSTTLSAEHNEGTWGMLYEYDYSELDHPLFCEIVLKEKINIVNHSWFIPYLNYTWMRFAKKSFFNQMYMYIGYMFCFMVATYLFRVNGEGWENSSIIQQCFEVVTCLITILYLKREIFEIKKIGSYMYCSNTWNYFDILQYLSVLSLIPLRITNSSYQYSVMALLSPLFWIKYLHFARGFKLMGPFVRMLFRIMIDIFNFVSLFCLFLFGFSHGFFMLFGGDIPLPSLNTTDLVAEEYSSLTKSILTLFNMNLGDFNYDTISNSSFTLTSHFLFLSFNILSVIVLMNLLIAIMGDSYSSINERAEKEWRVELAKLILNIQTVPDEMGVRRLEPIKKLFVLEDK